MTTQVVLVDNFDSFSFNLVDELARAGCEVTVVRNDQPAEDVLALAASRPAPRLLVLSPGPGTPGDAGCCVELVRGAGQLPVFGVCLGLQAMVCALGGQVGGAGEIVHGKPSAISHDGRGIFCGLENPLSVGRYHSLVATRVPDTLEVSARFGDLVMAARHRERPLVGVQFHPESILTPHGSRMIANVVRWAHAMEAQA